MAYVILGAITHDEKPATGWATVRVTKPFEGEGDWQLTSAEHVGEDV